MFKSVSLPRLNWNYDMMWHTHTRTQSFIVKDVLFHKSNIFCPVGTTWNIKITINKIQWHKVTILLNEEIKLDNLQLNVISKYYEFSFLWDWLCFLGPMFLVLISGLHVLRVTVTMLSQGYSLPFSKYW